MGYFAKDWTPVNAATPLDPIAWPGGRGMMVCHCTTWGSVNIRLDVSFDNGQSWVTAPYVDGLTNNGISVDGPAMTFLLPQCMIKPVCTAGTSITAGKLYIREMGRLSS